MDKESTERILSQREIDKTDFIMLFSRKDDCEEDFREAATYTGVRILTDYCRVRGYDAALFLSETDEDYYWILAYSKKDYYSFIESVKKGAELLKERYYFTDELSDNVFILRSDLEKAEKIIGLAAGGPCENTVDKLVQTLGISFQSAVFVYQYFEKRRLEALQTERREADRLSALSELKRTYREEELRRVLFVRRFAGSRKDTAVLYYALRKGMLFGRVYTRNEVRDFMGLSETDCGSLEKKMQVCEYEERKKHTRVSPLLYLD